MRHASRRRDQQGFSLFDILIALGVASALIATVFAVRVKVRKQSQDMRLVQTLQIFERAVHRAYPDGNYESLTAPALVARTGELLKPYYQWVDLGWTAYGQFNYTGGALNVYPASGYRRYNDTGRVASTVYGQSFSLGPAKKVDSETCIEIGRAFLPRAVEITVWYPAPEGESGGWYTLSPRAGDSVGDLSAACTVSGWGWPNISVELP